jgi:lipoprotein-anchoring transpeptidase ErfK/SrfK
VSRYRNGSPEWAPGWWSEFTYRYGWRAYALPVLVLLTFAALLQDPRHAAARPTTHHVAGATPHVTNEGGPAQSSDAAPDPVTVRSDAESVACSTNDAGQLALVSISQQHAWMCSGHMQVYSTPVTTGASANNDATPLGSWRVQSRETDRYLVGAGYSDYVHYWVPFNGDFGFHDATWQTMPFGSSGYTTGGSHGCVHMPMPAMAWFFGWAQVDSTVVTIEA